MMTRLARAWLLALALFGALPGFAAASPANSAEATAPPQQLLVMVALPVSHFRPGSAYGGGYGDTLARSAIQRTARAIARRHGLEVVESWPMPTLGISCIVMALPADRDAAAVLAVLQNDRDVIWAQPNNSFNSLGKSGAADPLYPAQPAAQRWNLTRLHTVATGRGASLAVIDSGIDSQHPDLATTSVRVRDFTASARHHADMHGTSVAGIIAARPGNGIGIAGIAPDVQILGMRACQERDDPRKATCDSLSLARALQFAIERNVAIVNLSLSGPHDLLMERLLMVALRQQMIIVAAYDSSRPSGGFPAGMRGIVAVSDLPAPSDVILAPGQDIPTTRPGGLWHLVSGSSYAVAHVSGLAALLLEHRSRRDTVDLLGRFASANAADSCALLSASKHCP